MAYEFSLSDIKGLIDGAIGPVNTSIEDLKEDIVTLYKHVDAIKTAVNPRIERHSKDLKYLKESVEEHELIHKDIDRNLRENGRDNITKKSFKWQRIFTVCLIIFNFVSISLAAYIALVK